MTGREGPGPERPGPDYPPEWDAEPDDDGELLAANRDAEESEPTVWGPPPGPDPWSSQGPVPPPPF